jgi:hypothetical protein
MYTRRKVPCSVMLSIPRLLHIRNIFMRLRFVILVIYSLELGSVTLKSTDGIIVLKDETIEEL